MHLRVRIYPALLQESSSLLGPTSQYRMHFRSRLSRFAILFVRGLFHARLSRFDPSPTPLFAPRSSARGMFYLARMTYMYPECIPVCKSRERRVFAANCSLSTRNAEKWDLPSNKKLYKRSYTFFFHKEFNILCAFIYLIWKDRKYTCTYLII